MKYSLPVWIALLLVAGSGLKPARAQGGGDLSVIDTISDMVVETIGVGLGPQAIEILPDGSKVYVANYLAGTVSVVATATDTVTTVVPVGPGPLTMSLLK